ncbi:CotO family spore coat protein [Aciduricibacillus chroicocephali]|uniref:CotO family spore coat protein n=1 Tax=Aciduricibacillus chroicocephali TaxID=3054939 RepID=A0ABY9KXI2_9BACI|nr:CotO family spore coat protein [Bacillaceae bacterium 44XB]
MGESRYAKKPLLYIEQPGIREPKAEMQTTYRSPSRKDNAQPSSLGSDSNSSKGSRGTGKKRNAFHEQLLASQKGRKRPATEYELSKAEEEEKVTEPQNEKKVEAEAVVSEQKEQEQSDKKQNVQKNTSPEFVHLPFNELDLRGKINYFLNKPPLVPVLKCELRTSEQTHLGVIEKFENEIVHLRKKRKANPELIPFEEITSIRLLGF